MNPKDLVGAKKAPMDLVPVAGAIMAAPAHQDGADKYGAFNWRLQPVQLMTYIGATKRHLDAFIDGQDFAEDTGLHHLSHMIANLNIVADALGLGNLLDNRPPKGPAADMLRAQDKSLAPRVVLDHDHSLDPDDATGDVEATNALLRTLGLVASDTQFLCGHMYGEDPNADCGTAVHWSRVNGVELKAGPSEEANCNCETDWPEHGFECPLFNVARP